MMDGHAPQKIEVHTSRWRVLDPSNEKFLISILKFEP
jgi:hypothetical protein